MTDKKDVLLFTLRSNAEEFLKDFDIIELKDGLKRLKSHRNKAKSGNMKAFFDMDIVFLERYIRNRTLNDKT